MRGLAIDPGEYGQVWYVDVPLQVYSTPRFVLQTAVCPYVSMDYSYLHARVLVLRALPDLMQVISTRMPTP